MSTVGSELALLRDPRLAELATSECPAWLWSADGVQILWANAVGAAVFGAETSISSTRRHFYATDTPAVQVIRLAATLPVGGQGRLERLRGFGGGYGRALTCACSRIVIQNGSAAVLIAATERAGPALALAERVRRLFGDSEDVIAGFAPDGGLLYANPAGRSRLAGATNLSALNVGTLAAATREGGSATGTTRLDGRAFDVVAIHLGRDASYVILIVLRLTSRQGSVQKAVQDAVQNRVQDGVTVKAEPSHMPPEPILPRTIADAAAVFMSLGETKPTAMQRRHPLRFVWHLDADSRFAIASDEFVQLVGPRAARVGGTWNEIAAALTLDPNNQVERAFASRETWSGIVVSWPVTDSDTRLPIELSGLPVFDRDRTFRGYRGFGVCRDVDRINKLVRARREAQKVLSSPGSPPQPSSPQSSSPVPREPDAAPAMPAAAAVEKTDSLEPAKPDDAAVAVSASPSESPGLVESLANVVPFRPAPPVEPKTSPSLSPVERKAFREIAQELTSRLRGSPASGEGAIQGAVQESAATGEAPCEAPTPSAEINLELALLDHIPLGVLVLRNATLLHANQHFLEWSGYNSVAAIEAAGGLQMLFTEPGTTHALTESGHPHALGIKTARGDKLPVEGRMFRVPWNGSAAIVLILTNGQFEAAVRNAENALHAAEAEIGELKSVLDAASDGVMVLDAEGKIAGANARAASLFAKPADELTGSTFAGLFAPDSENAICAHLAGVLEGAQDPGIEIDVAGLLGDGRSVPLVLTFRRSGDNRVCALLRDVTMRKRAEEELHNAKREWLSAASAKADFLARISHEIRTPLNAMMGLAEAMMVERFGPIGNERYREYIKDIHIAGSHLASMISDLLDLSKLETGRMELAFADLNLNDLVQQCVGIMQPQANSARIIIRSALAPGLPRVLADERLVRQIVFNLLSNSIRLTGPGGQIIVSTVFSDAGQVVLRVRDTGAGMSEKDIKAAAEPFRDTATSASLGSAGTGFGLSLTTALAKANHAQFSIKSAPEAGTLIEIAFPPNRVATTHA